MPASTKSPIRVALADDHTMFRKGILSLLNSAPEFQVVAEASNGLELIQLLAKLETLPDVCLLDINMPKMNGFDTLIALKKTYPDMKFLILTMFDHEFVILRMLRNGANGYLLKEDDPDELKRAIEYVYNRTFYHSELVSGRLISMVQKGVEYSHIQLTDNEQVFLEFCCSELTYKEIAEKMSLSVRTVEGYRDTLFEKLNIHSRTGLVIYAMKLGIANVI